MIIMRYLKSICCFIAFLTVFGCLGGEPTQSSTTVKPVSTVEPTSTVVRPEVTTTLKPDVKRFQNAISGTDDSACNTITNEQLKDVCIRDIAVKNKDLASCEKIVTGTIQDTCYHMLAVVMDRPGLCNEIENEFIKDSCVEKSGA